MPEQLAVDLAWLGGGAAFAALICAFAQLAAFLPSHFARARSTPRCANADHARDALHKQRLVCAMSLALLLTLPPVALAAASSHAIQASMAVEAGVIAGLIFASRRDFARRARAVALGGGVLGVGLIAGAFALFFLRADLAAFARVALFVAVALGAVLAGGAFGVFGSPRAAPIARVAVTGIDPFTLGAAILLGIALGFAFASAQARPEFGASVLMGASVLGAALGARLMSGAHKPRRSRLPNTPQSLQQRLRATFNASFAGVSDEWLVAACGGGTFAPAWLTDIDASNGGVPRAQHHASQDLPRRRRSRRGALRQRQGPH